MTTRLERQLRTPRKKSFLLSKPRCLSTLLQNASFSLGSSSVRPPFFDVFLQKLPAFLRRFSGIFQVADFWVSLDQFKIIKLHIRKIYFRRGHQALGKLQPPEPLAVISVHLLYGWQMFPFSLRMKIRSLHEFGPFLYPFRKGSPKL